MTITIDRTDLLELRLSLESAGARLDEGNPHAARECLDWSIERINALLHPVAAAPPLTPEETNRFPKGRFTP